jgi:hypothetical protein
MSVAENGRLPASDLAPIAGGQLAKAAAAAWNTMNIEARRRGLELLPEGPLGSYRDFAGQEKLYQAYLNGTGNLAAVPGTSNHGWGLAVDLATPEMRTMLDSIGREYGWAKAWSDAQSEWWHIAWRAGVWSGHDPGPEGPVTITIPEDEDMITSATDGKGQVHVFVFVPKSKDDPRAGGTVFEMYEQKQDNGTFKWATDKHGVKAEAYHLGQVPTP